jgi:hypothetical protein
VASVREINGFNNLDSKNGTISNLNSNTDTTTTTGIIHFQPKLANERLYEIKLYDRMKCFPKVLCTLTKAEAFKKLGYNDLNELADGYLKLLSAFPGGPPM